MALGGDDVVEDNDAAEFANLPAPARELDVRAKSYRRRTPFCGSGWRS